MIKVEKIMEGVDRKNPPALTLAKRPGTISSAALRRVVDENLSGIPDEKRQVVLGLLYLWHDHGKEAHEATEKYEGTSDSDYLHSLFHRREGDYSNSEYWLNEAGEHPMYGILGPKTEALLSADEKLKAKVLPQGRWDAKGFVRAVKAQPDSALLRAVQAEEFIAYLEWLTG